MGYRLFHRHQSLICVLLCLRVWGYAIVGLWVREFVGVGVGVLRRCVCAYVFACLCLFAFVLCMIVCDCL